MRSYNRFYQSITVTSPQKLGCPVRFELTISSATNLRLNQLGYGQHLKLVLANGVEPFKNGVWNRLNNRSDKPTFK